MGERLPEIPINSLDDFKKYVLEPQDTALREKVAELNLHYLELLRARDDYTPTMVASELTGLVMELLAGYHHCPEGEWPVLTDEEISRVIATAPAPCPMEFKDEPKIRALLMAQRDADRAHCPVQEGK